MRIITHCELRVENVKDLKLHLLDARVPSQFLTSQNIAYGKALEGLRVAVDRSELLGQAHALKQFEGFSRVWILRV